MCDAAKNNFFHNASVQYRKRFSNKIPQGKRDTAIKGEVITTLKIIPRGREHFKKVRKRSVKHKVSQRDPTVNRNKK